MGYTPAEQGAMPRGLLEEDLARTAYLLGLVDPPPAPPDPDEWTEAVDLPLQD